ncbi:hypothetical protein MKW98_008458 [Papaver atlanticum]|uniref:Uncharacterized protein n=1 Tax=Papaver atlanticum TaxID=357466 RepID=A0AAD4SIW7_9MAGN|nr:hypothetical protein MKW98_008458 [Papaver atlanticum]
MPTLNQRIQVYKHYISVVDVEEIFHLDTDVEEIPPFNTGVQDVTPTHGISVPSSLNGSTTLSSSTVHEPNSMYQMGDYTMPSIPYYCPQFDSEDPTLVEAGEATHHMESNESFLALL